MKEAYGIKIYENLKEVVNPKHTCLVAWDIQNGLVERTFNRGEFVRDIKNLIEALRGKVPLVYTNITPPEREFRSSWAFYSMMKRFGVSDPEKLPDFLKKGSQESEIGGGLEPKPGDVLLDKPAASIFIGTNFEYMMRARGITTLIFTGIATEFGIESSARDGANRGFYPVIATDCVSSMDREGHERSLLNMQRLFICENSKTIIEAVLSEDK